MSLMYVSSEGAMRLLEFTLAKQVAVNFVLHLFTNDVTPSEEFTAASFTELAIAGYTPALIPISEWDMFYRDGRGEARALPKTFTFDPGYNTIVYGYFVTDESDDTLLWSERFEAPKSLQYRGDGIRITPKITLRKG